MHIFKNDLEKRLFLALQEGLEISENPLKAIEGKLNLSELEILASYSSFVQKGLVRRFGAVFEPSRLGYQSVLCAAKTTNFDEIKNSISGIREITHCYIRDYEYNLWFTFTARRNEFRTKLDSIRNVFGSKILELPVVKKFKTTVIFNLGLPVARTSCPCFTKEVIEFDSADISIADSLYELTLSNNIFNAHLIKKLNLWKSSGALKRIALVPFHREVGYKANAMCVWKVEAAKVDFTGSELSKSGNVTHCYERTPIEGKFPYNLFAMMHSDTLEHINQEFNQINNFLDLFGGKMLTTLHEIKKSSFKPF